MLAMIPTSTLYRYYLYTTATVLDLASVATVSDLHAARRACRGSCSCPYSCTWILRLPVLPVLPVDLNRSECTGIGIPILDVAVIVAYVVA